MEALLYSSHQEEAAILASVIQQTGLTARTSHHLDQTISTWPDHPSDLILLSLTQDYSKAVLQVEQLRAVSVVPIVILCDPIAEDLIVKYYLAGADLVIVRPYSIRQLLYILRAQLRHSNSISFYSLPILTHSGFSLDPSNRTVSVETGPPKHLTQLEFRLLYTLMIHAGQMIPYENIVEQVWGFSGEGGRDLVRGLVQRLRSKVEKDPQSPKYIHTEPGLGYYFLSTQEDQ